MNGGWIRAADIIVELDIGGGGAEHSKFIDCPNCCDRQVLTYDADVE
mgnify:CR=1 FL=1